MNTDPTPTLMLSGNCFDIQYASQAAKQRLRRTCGSATGAPARTQPPKNKIIFMKNHPMHREDPLHTVCSIDPEMLLSSHRTQGPKTYSMYLKIDIDLKVSLVFSTLGSLQQPSSYSMWIAQCSVFIEILWTELGHFTRIAAAISFIQYEYIIDHAEFEFDDTQSQLLHCSIFIQYVRILTGWSISSMLGELRRTHPDITDNSSSSANTFIQYEEHRHMSPLLLPLIYKV